MAATKRQMNWSTVSFAGTVIDGITQGSIGKGANLLKFAGDMDVICSTIVVNSMEPHANFTSGDVAAVEALVPGTVGTFVGTLADAKLATGGAITYTGTSNAVVDNVDMSAAHAGWGTATFGFAFFSTDGVTYPLVVSRV